MPCSKSRSASSSGSSSDSRRLTIVASCWKAFSNSFCLRTIRGQLYSRFLRSHRMEDTATALESGAMKVYISHGDRNQKFADALRDRLTALGLDVWNPKRELYPGSNWMLEAGRALERADGVVFLFSPDVAHSP